jgi:exopolyphosphatase/pppGpp-phosphohydrolase
MTNTNLSAVLLILSEAFNTFKLKEMTVSENALREGIIIDTISKLAEMQDLTV